MEGWKLVMGSTVIYVLNLNHFNVWGESYNILHKAHGGSKVAAAIHFELKYFKNACCDVD